MLFKGQDYGDAAAFWRVLVDALPQEIAVVGQDGVIVAANVGWTESAAPLCEGLQGLGLRQNLIDALRAHADRGALAASRLLAGLEAILAGESEGFRFDYAPDADGQSSRFALDVRRLPLDPPALLLCRRDVTAERRDYAAALQESEQRERQRSAELQAIFDAAPIGLAIAQSSSGDRIRGNPALERMFGVASGGELSKTAKESVDLRLFQSGRELSVSELPMQRAVRGEVVSGELYDVVCPDRAFTALATARPIYDEAGKPRGAVGAFMDFTQITKAEAALRESEERFRGLVEAYAQAVWEADSTGAVVSDSPSWRAKTGQTGDELLGDGWLNAVHPDDRAHASLKWREATVARGNYDVECRLKDRAGGWRWINLRATPTLNADGTVRKWIGMNIDIDARKRAESALRASEERYRESELRLQLALDSGNIGIYEWRLDTGEVIWDDRLRALRGLPPGQRPTFDSFIQSLHPDDRARVRVEIDRALDPKAGGRFHAEYRALTGDMSEKWISVTGTVFFEAGRAVRMVGTAQDVSQRKRAEIERQKFVSLAEQSVEFIGICNLSFEPLYVNPAGLRLVGLTSAEAAAKVKVDDFFFPEDRDFVMRQFFPGVLREGQGSVEIRFRRFDTGEAVWMLYNVFFLRDPDGAPIGLATVSRDITQRKRAEEALKAADRRKDEFLATLAHELRNPLAPICNATHVLVQEAGPTLSTRDLGLLRMIERQSRHLVRLVDDLMEISRITSGKVELKLQRVELADVLRRALETAWPVIDRVGHELRVALPAEPMALEADPVRLAQVFTNLLDNAAKYTERGGVISLTAARAGDEAIVTVSDSGVGIPAEMLPRVFDLFTQVDRSLGRAQGGLGIGLALVKNLLDLHGATVEAHSDGLGRGSAFVVRLPLSPVGAQAPMSTAIQTSKPMARRILVIDDDHDVADSLVMLLETFGVEVRVAYDGEAGLEALRRFEPELVFLDLGMPKMDGYETARRLRELPEGRAVMLVALTGWGRDQISDRARDAGFDHQLTKPAAFEDLQKLLESLR